jgi:hypothetical protein
MEITYSFSRDVYNLSLEDFKVFVKGRYPEVTIKEIKKIHKDGYVVPVSGKPSKT